MPSLHFYCGRCTKRVVRRSGKWAHEAGDTGHEPQPMSGKAKPEPKAPAPRRRIPPQFWTEAREQLLVDRYQEHAARYDLQTLADELEISIHALKSKAKKMGLQRKKRSGPKPSKKAKRQVEEVVKPWKPGDTYSQPLAPTVTRKVNDESGGVVPVHLSSAVRAYVAKLVGLGLHGSTPSEVVGRLTAQRVEQMIVDRFLEKARRVGGDG